MQQERETVVRPLRRALLWAGLGVGATVVLIALIISIFNWNFARPFVNYMVSSAIHREFHVRGNLAASLTFGHPVQSGWRRYVPQPRIIADDVIIANANWASGPYLLSVSRVDLTVDPIPLMAGTLSLTELRLDRPTAALERAVDRHNNWSFKTTGGPGWRIVPHHMSISDGRVHYADPAIKLDVTAVVNTIKANGKSAYGLEFSIEGTYNKTPVSGKGEAGELLSLTDSEVKYPLSFTGNVGQNTVSLQGEITQPFAISAVDLQLALSGKSMADLFPLTSVVLPESPPYAVKGRLLGVIAKADSRWEYKQFTGTVGDSDLAGTLEYLTTRPRPLLRGEVNSRLLRLSDLGPAVGAESNQQKISKGKAPVQPNNKALPVASFNPVRWGAMDADVKFTGTKIVRTHNIPLKDLSVDLHMKDRVLSLTPLNFGMADGNVTSVIVLNGRDGIIRGQIKMAARKLKIKELFPKLGSMRASFGEVNGDAALAGQGNSVSAMLGTANGELNAVISDGSVSKFILEAAGLNIANVIFVKLFGDKQIHLNCMSGQFGVKKGLAQVKTFVFDTDDTVIDISGNVDVARELLNLDVRPKNKSVRIFSLRSPLYAKGSFKNPDIGVYKGPLVAKAAVAGALAIVSPVAVILPLVNLGGAESVDCASLLARASAPPHLTESVQKVPKSLPLRH